LLRLERTVWQGKALCRVCSNGFSELLSNVAFSFVSILYNAKLMALEGENGVAAYGVLMYVSMIFSAVFIGYCVGTAPVVSYHYGAANHGELRSLRKKNLRIAALFSVSMFALAEGLALPLTHLFVGYDVALTALTLRAFRICSLYYLFFGVGIFGSSFFTALNNGKISAIISFFRTLVFQIAAIYVLPLLVNGIDGIWLSLVVAEVLAALLTVAFLVANRKKYHY
jgi:Na+-driven multidrug efflux pump